MKICRPLNKHINRHFGGIAVLYKSELKPGITFLEHQNNDYLWLKMDRQFFGLDEDVFMCIVYIPPENSSYYKVRNQDTLAYINEDLAKYTTLGKIILAGDFNARSNVKNDFIRNDNGDDIDTFHYIADKEILTRNSQDMADACSRGRKLIDMCISARLRIANGRCMGDSLGQFTCHKYGGSSVIDYLITSEENLKRIMYFRVNPFLGQLSDHCCISWAMKCNLLKSKDFLCRAKPNID